MSRVVRREGLGTPRQALRSSVRHTSGSTEDRKSSSPVRISSRFAARVMRQVLPNMRGSATHHFIGRAHKDHIDLPDLPSDSATEFPEPPKHLISLLF